jgi:hypothetical protein
MGDSSRGGQKTLCTRVVHKVVLMLISYYIYSTDCIFQRQAQRVMYSTCLQAIHGVHVRCESHRYRHSSKAVGPATEILEYQFLTGLLSTIFRCFV